MNKKTIPAVIITFVVTILFSVPITAVLAEQSGGTPESGGVSRIKAIYDSLVSLGHGSDSSGSWGDWGAYWNRIRGAGEWTPDSGLEPEEVSSGETLQWIKKKPNRNMPQKR